MPIPKELTPIDPTTERQALAMVARGDSYQSIAKALHIAPKSVYNIKQRNSELLIKMQEKVENHRQKQAEKILGLAQERIIERLNKPNPLEKLTDYNTVAKTAYDQVRLEEGKATSISATAAVNPEQATPENLEALVQALKSGDEVEMTRLLWRKQ